MKGAAVLLALALIAPGPRAEAAPSPIAAADDRAPVPASPSRVDAGAASQPAAPGPRPSSPSAVTYGLFGTLHLARPQGAIRRVAMLVSDRDGWTPRQETLAAELAREGVFVVGVDFPAYLGRMQAIASNPCSYPAAHFEEVAHWIERHEGLVDYEVPLVVGDGAGATFAYAMAAQAPAGTFDGLVTLGWDASLRFSKAFCPGDAGAMTVADAAGFRVAPVSGFPVPWHPRPFARGARLVGLGATFAQALRFAATIWPPLGAPARADGTALARAGGSRDDDAAALPDDVADLPLIEVEPTAAATVPPRIAVVLTGDGGWAGLDRGVADALAAQGVRVVGFSTLKFFWQKRTPEAAAQAIARVLAHYGKDAPDARFVLVGYSFGASLVPVVANRLPEALRRRVQAGVMISPDDEAVFEIHVGDWFGSTHHDEALPIAPEIAASKTPLVCVHGAEEEDGPCRRPTTGMREASLPGGHHYDGDYAALGALIVRSLDEAAR